MDPDRDPAGRTGLRSVLEKLDGTITSSFQVTQKNRIIQHQLWKQEQTKYEKSSAAAEET